MASKCSPVSAAIAESCRERRVTRKDQAGRKIEEIQYYHRAVGCQMIPSPVKPFLGWEWLQPGDREEDAALRLLRRLPEAYGSRFFGILVLDALYAQTPVLELAQEKGWEVVISLKQNSRDLYQSAVRLFASRPPDATFSETQGYKTYRVQLWDTEGLPFTIDNPARCAWSARRRSWNGIVIARASAAGIVAITNGCGSPLLRPLPFQRA
jgi:hypothetical protein